MRTAILSALMLTSVTSFAAESAPKEQPIHVATCRDGKEMYAETADHRGACSGHGGVAKWADGSPVKGKAKRTSYK